MSNVTGKTVEDKLKGLLHFYWTNEKKPHVIVVLTGATRTWKPEEEEL